MKALVRRLYRGAVRLAFTAGTLGGQFPRRLAPPYDARRVQRILVIRLGLLGDGTALLAPALHALRACFPAAQIDVLATPVQATLLESQPVVDGVVRWEGGDLFALRHAVRGDGWRQAASAVRELRRRRYDLALSCYGELASAIALASGARHRVGFAQEALPGTLTHWLRGGRYDREWHEAQYNLALVEAVRPPSPGELGASSQSVDSSGGDATGTVEPVTPPAWPLTLHVEPSTRERARALLAPVLSRAQSPIVLHPGATNGAAKRWPEVYWAALAARLAGDGHAVVLVGGSEDRAAAERVKVRSQGAGSVHDLVGRTSVPELLAVLEQAAVVISGDSGPMHLANALRRPLVAIHGPTDPAVTGPYDRSRTVVVRHELACSPCYRLDRVANCPLGHTLCQRLISPDEVYRAVQQALALEPSKAALAQAHAAQA